MVGASGQRHWGMVCHFDGRGVCLFLQGGEWNTEGIVFWLFFLWPCEGGIPHDERGKEVATCSGKKLSSSGCYFDSRSVGIGR